VKSAESSRQTAFARNLRQRQTDAERKLWAKLRSKQLEGVKFRRQQPIGPYIVDFVSFEKKIVVEIDGGQHNDDMIREKDEARTTLIEGKGYRLLRFWDNEVLTNTEGVLEKIRASL
jgi:very-short-patch-repair endonuclease